MSRNVSLPHTNQPISFGRDPKADERLPYAHVSWRHALLSRTAEGYYELSDLNSTNGTFLNGSRVSAPVLLKEGDKFQIGMTFYQYRKGLIEAEDLTESIRVDVKNLSLTRKVRGKEENYLQNVSFGISPKEVVAIVGGSGAGKSTLLKAITGFVPGTKNSVFFNEIDYYNHLPQFQPMLGYVPQDDIVHNELTVYSVLYYAAKLRLPPDTPLEEITQRIDTVLKELSIDHLPGKRVAKLSGGQRKRLNVGVELLSQPSLLFLDEPTSGLDPGLERSFMNMLKQLAQAGRTIILVSHSVDSILVCDKVAFMGMGGKLTFFGTPEEAKSFFQVDDLALVYQRIDSREKADLCAAKYESWSGRIRYVPRIQNPQIQPSSAQAILAAYAFGNKSGKISGFKQFLVLVARYVSCIIGDTRNLVYILGQAPVIALLLGIVFRTNIFTADVHNLSPKTTPPILDAPMLLFFMTISSIFFSVANAAKEMTKESAIYRRERTAKLRITPYLLSKVLVQFLICAVQCLLLLTIVSVQIPLDVGISKWVAIYAVLLLVSVCGMLLGLTISALSQTNDQAATLVPYIVLPQIIFSGVIGLKSKFLIAVSDWLFPSRWAYGILGNIEGINPKISQLGEQFSRSASDIFDTSQRHAFLALGAFCCCYGMLAWIALRLKERLSR